MSNTRSGAGAEAGTPRQERLFIDEEGVRWRVYEQPFADYDRRCGVSLIFASDAAVRRVRDYPANWAEASDEDLAALSWRA